MTLKEIQQKFPYIPSWVEYINSLLPTGLSVDENEIIIVTVPTFFEQLLKNTTKRTMANYLMRRIALPSTYYLTEELRNFQLTFFSAESGQQEYEPRWKECIDITEIRCVLRS